MCQANQNQLLTSRCGQFILCVVLLSCFAWLPVTSSADQIALRQLNAGQTVERRMLGGETHDYQIDLPAGHFLRVVADQRGIDLSLMFFSPRGQKLSETDSLNSTQGFEIAAVGAEESGSYRLRVESSSKNVPPGNYELKLETLRPITEPDQQWLSAQQAYDEGMQLYARATAETLPQAEQKFAEALRIWQVIEDQVMVTHTLYYLAGTYQRLGKTQQAFFHSSNALQLVRTSADRREEAAALTNLANLLTELGESRKALQYYEESLIHWRAFKDVYGEARALRNLALVNTQLGDPRLALERFAQARVVWQQLGNRPQLATTLLNAGGAYETLGEWQHALENFTQARAIYQEIDDRRNIATSFASLGAVYLKLGETRQAIDHFQNALTLRRALGVHRAEAVTLGDLGLAEVQQQNYSQALDYYQQALKLMREAADHRGEAQILQRLGELQAQLNEPAKAKGYFEQALPLLRSAGDLNNEAVVLTSLAKLRLAAGASQPAVDNLQKALTLLRQSGNRTDEAETLYTLALAERARGDLTAARQQSAAAITKIEAVRAGVINKQLRTSYFATAQKYYQLDIDLLMQTHRAQPNADFAAQALHASERARARSLLEELAEARADIRRGADAALLVRERELQQLLNAKGERQLQLTSQRGNETSLKELRQELNALETEYQQLQTKIRQSSPHYAALTQPQPLSLAEIQQTLDAETVLLEFALGEERSYLWAVTKDALASYELPPQAQINNAALELQRLLTARGVRVNGETLLQQRTRLERADSQLPAAARALSQLLLAPIAERLRKDWAKRTLLVVADGALQYVPFAMLPAPEESGRVGDGATGGRGDGASQSAIRNPQSAIPLIVDHEVVSLPSVSALAELRKEVSGRAPAPKLLAVLADPVFSRADAQARAQTPVASSARARSLQHEAEAPALKVGRFSIQRLPYTRQEAERIYALAPGNDNFKALDFKATRTLALSPELGQYRYLHFATHGLLDSENPTLSALAFSLVDEKGTAQDGFLRAHELYNLNLPADLVVLSACQTGLGKAYKGEGLVGLTRGFMYAGAARVVVSLWNVNDRATAELMEKFYTRLLKDGQRPAAALRAAQVEMWQQKQWQSPYYWAGFGLQGEWR